MNNEAAKQRSRVRPRVKWNIGCLKVDCPELNTLDR